MTYEPYRELLADWQIAEAIRDAKSDDQEIANAAREQLPELIAKFFDGRGAGTLRNLSGWLDPAETPLSVRQNAGCLQVNHATGVAIGYRNSVHEEQDFKEGKRTVSADG